MSDVTSSFSSSPPSSPLPFWNKLILSSTTNILSVFSYRYPMYRSKYTGEHDFDRQQVRSFVFAHDRALEREDEDEEAAEKGFKTVEEEVDALLKNVGDTPTVANLTPVLDRLIRLRSEIDSFLPPPRSHVKRDSEFPRAGRLVDDWPTREPVLSYRFAITKLIVTINSVDKSLSPLEKNIKRCSKSMSWEDMRSLALHHSFLFGPPFAFGIGGKEAKGKKERYHRFISVFFPAFLERTSTNLNYSSSENYPYQSSSSSSFPNTTPSPLTSPPPPPTSPPSPLTSPPPPPPRLTLSDGSKVTPEALKYFESLQLMLLNQLPPDSEVSRLLSREESGYWKSRFLKAGNPSILLALRITIQIAKATNSKNCLDIKAWTLMRKWYCAPVINDHQELLDGCARIFEKYVEEEKGGRKRRREE